MKENKLTYISSEDDTKLEMTGRDLQYCVLLNTDGTVKSMKVSNGEWIAELPSGKKITDLNSSDLKDVPSGYKFECNGSTSQTPLPAKSFGEDSWKVIASNAKKCVNNEENCPYKVGNTKTVKVNGKEFTVRLANLKAPNECNNSGFSQSACGFVVEFADVITTHNMNPTSSNKGGWLNSQMKTFIDNDIYNSLPEELRNVIIDTKTVSGHGKEDTNNITSPEDKLDKLYLLAPKEIYSDWSDQYDTARDKTRQLDYYNIKSVTTNSYAAAKKNSWWWLRSASSTNSYAFYNVCSNGDWGSSYAYIAHGVSPAFRIG